MKDKSLPDNKSSRKQWLWFIAIYFISLLVFTLSVATLHLFIPH